MGAMAIKRYSIFPKASALLELHHQIALCHILDTRWLVLISLQNTPIAEMQSVYSAAPADRAISIKVRIIYPSKFILCKVKTDI